MKRTVFIFISLLSVVYSYSQILIDNGPLVDPNLAHLRYGISGAKWNKLSLTYYIDNTSNHLTAAQRQSIIQQAFQTWSAASYFLFTQVSSASSADLKIKWATGNHGDGNSFDGAAGVLAHAFYPPPLGGSYAGQIHFDDAEPWSATTTSGISLLSVAIHEIGHALGLEHSEAANSIMKPYYTGQTTLGADDILAICTLSSPTITSISGPTTAYYNPNTVSGIYYRYEVNPSPSVPEGTYEWSTDPATTHIAPIYNNADIKFLAPGSYVVRVRAKSSCGSYSGYTIHYVSVTTASSYSLSQVSPKVFSLSETNPGVTNRQRTILTVDYTLVSAVGGAAVASGKMSASGGTLDFSHVSAGIYVLRIDTGSGTPETFKIVLK